METESMGSIEILGYNPGIAKALCRPGLLHLVHGQGTPCDSLHTFSRDSRRVTTLTSRNAAGIGHTLAACAILKAMYNIP
ncbi:MAG: hypothetical protein M3Y81_28470, partial [Chloroflexota bacterium]|nr:hypothetical protein [Chloroflexota bacterium]